MDIAELAERGRRAACKLDRDLELAGAADEAVTRAIASYDPSRGVPLEAWVVMLSKQEAVGYLRKRNSRREVPLAYRHDGSDPDRAVRYAEADLEPRFRTRIPYRPRGDVKDASQLAAPVEQLELLVCRDDWELLCEKYIERWNLVAMARKRETTVSHVRELIAAAVGRFVRAYEESR